MNTSTMDADYIASLTLTPSSTSTLNVNLIGAIEFSLLSINLISKQHSKLQLLLLNPGLSSPMNLSKLKQITLCKLTKELILLSHSLTRFWQISLSQRIFTLLFSARPNCILHICSDSQQALTKRSNARNLTTISQ